MIDSSDYDVDNSCPLVIMNARPCNAKATGSAPLANQWSASATASFNSSSPVDGKAPVRTERLSEPSANVAGVPSREIAISGPRTQGTKEVVQRRVFQQC